MEQSHHQIKQIDTLHDVLVSATSIKYKDFTGVHLTKGSLAHNIAEIQAIIKMTGRYIFGAHNFYELLIKKINELNTQVKAIFLLAILKKLSQVEPPKPETPRQEKTPVPLYSGACISAWKPSFKPYEVIA